TGETAGEGFGTSASVAGGVDGDGIPDLIVGAWQYSRDANSAGRAHLHSGKDGRLMKAYTCRIPAAAFGFDAAAMVDIGGDGAVDWGGRGGGGGGEGVRSGRVFLVSSGMPRRVIRKV